MKALSLLAALFTTNVFAAPAPQFMVLKIEKSAQQKLGDDSIEVLSADVEFVGRSLVAKVSFSYDKEFFEPDYSVATFNCEGQTLGSEFTFTKLVCEEEEPILWDEF